MTHRKLPRKINVNKVFIAPARIPTNEVDKNGKNLYRQAMKILYVNRNDKEYELVDLETKIVCVDENEYEALEEGAIIVSSSKLVPINSFVSKKYKNKSLSQDKIIEIGKFIVRNSHSVNITTILNLINYHKLYVVNVYNNKNKLIKNKAITYRIGNQFIDVDSKDIYLLDEGIIDKDIESDLKIIKPSEMLLMDDYMKSAENEKYNKILKRRKHEQI